MNTKASEIFEGENSSLRKTFNNAVEDVFIKETTDELWELLPEDFNYKGCNRKTLYNWLKSKLEYQYFEAIDQATMAERERWLNQPANEHDNQIRNELLKDISERLEELSLMTWRGYRERFNREDAPIDEVTGYEVACNDMKDYINSLSK